VAVITHDAKLNDLLVDLGRSLLQYADESWPWATTAEATAEREVRALAARQRENVSQLADLLADRGWPIDFGGYPTDYTDLHFLSLDYLVGELVRHQKQDIATLEQCIVRLEHDPAGRSLTQEVLGSERAHLEMLEELANQPAAGA
jgi:hypothetical protein